jgi:hypothetical protein
MRQLAIAALLAFLVTGCFTSPALLAVQADTITLKKSTEDVLSAAGQPDLILARSGVETFYYDRRDDLAVSVSMVNDVVVAFNDADVWPAAVAEAADDADKPVSKGAVHVGMSENELVQVLGPPSGLTARDGLETLHWLTSDKVDSAVEVADGKVIGFWDRPVSEFTQDLPTEGADRDNATTSGRIRVGMAQSEVESLLGEADGKSGEEGVIVHRYESDPLLYGDTIIYSVAYKEGRVVALYEFNESRDEAMKEKEEAKAAAAQAAARGEEGESAISSFLSNPLVQAALLGAVGGQQINVNKSSTSSTATRTLDINGHTYSGGEHLGQPCSLDNPCPSGYSCHLVTDSSGMCVQ